MNVVIIWDLDEDEEGKVQHIAEHGIETDELPTCSIIRLVATAAIHRSVQWFSDIPWTAATSRSFTNKSTTMRCTPSPRSRFLNPFRSKSWPSKSRATAS